MYPPWKIAFVSRRLRFERNLAPFTARIYYIYIFLPSCRDLTLSTDMFCLAKKVCKNKSRCRKKSISRGQPKSIPISLPRRVRNSVAISTGRDATRVRRDEVDRRSRGRRRLHTDGTRRRRELIAFVRYLKRLQEKRGLDHGARDFGVQSSLRRLR